MVYSVCCKLQQQRQQQQSTNTTMSHAQPTKHIAEATQSASKYTIGRRNQSTFEATIEEIFELLVRAMEIWHHVNSVPKPAKAVL